MNTSSGKTAQMNLVLLGGPGSGKGTQADNLQRAFGFHHISSGQLFREHLRSHTSLGDPAQTYMTRGDLVPDNVPDKIIEPPPRQLGGKIFLLDGSPRNTPQAPAFDKMLRRLKLPLTAVLN